MTPLANADGAQHGHEDQGHGGQDDDAGLPDAGHAHDPPRTQKHDHSEDVDEARGENPVPGAKENPLRDQELGEPPRRCLRTLVISEELIVVLGLTPKQGVVGGGSGGLDLGRVQRLFFPVEAEFAPIRF